MQEQDPTLDQWKELYTAAAMFKEYAPWQWMEDADVFGIENPKNGEIGYCCVVGGPGELLGLLVYLGGEGLAFFEGLQSGKIKAEDDDLHAVQKCLSISFEDREMLEKKDLAIIKSLGLKFRGRQTWPCFRSHSPGFAPWFLNGEETEFLSLALRRAIGIAERYKEDPTVLDPPDKDLYLVAYQEKDGSGGWYEKWSAPAPYEKKNIVPLVDEIRLARIKSTLQEAEDSWEVDFFFAPFIVEEGTRPIFPYVALYTVHSEGSIINFCLAPHDTFDAQFQSNFLEFIEKILIKPKAIMVKKDAVYDFLKPMTERLGIPLKRAKNLKAVEEAKNALINHMATQG